MFSSRKSSAPAAGGYNLTKSLRFRSSAGAYLNRTPASASNQKTWTWSGWVKRGTLGVRGTLFHAYNGSADQRGEFYFDTSDRIVFYKGGVSGEGQITTVSVFRDPSAWYHVVIKADYSNGTSADRAIIYVNNVAQTVTINATFANADGQINGNWAHSLGSQDTGQYFDGYMAEVNFVDGLALTPSSFGETSAATGVWQPIRYTGTYGTNGFYLKFTDTTSTATLGTDFSGNSNTWTVNNISLTSGSTYDSMTDVPTLTDATTANYAVFNPLQIITTGQVTVTNGNLTAANTSGGDSNIRGTMFVSTGKWYAELTITTAGSNYPTVGIIEATEQNLTYLGATAKSYCYTGGGSKGNNNSFTSYGASYTTGDVIGVAYDATNATLTFYKNGTTQGTAFTGVTAGSYTFACSTLTGTININFGQRAFTYTPPTGFVALNTFNLPTPTIGATAATTANKYFDATTYTGNGSSLAVTNSGAMQPDLLWTKARSSGAFHYLQDSVRGVNKALFSNSTDSEFTITSTTTTLNSNGFSFNGSESGLNANTSTYVGWQWRASNATAVANTSGSISSQVSANTTAGFSIVTYTGNGGTSDTIGHGLGVAPSMIIIKVRSNAIRNWIVYHASIGSTRKLQLNLSDADTIENGNFGGLSPTSTTFGVGYAATNGSSETFVAYCFAQVAGYSAFGSYTGNGSSDGPFIFTGFRPRYVLIKSTGIQDWIVWDTARDTYNASQNFLLPNTADSESGGIPIDFVSNGIKIRTTNGTLNSSGVTYIYYFVAENPFKYANAR